jgi:hypothetical protein
MVMKWVAELKDKTGRALPEWQKHIVTAGPKEMICHQQSQRYRQGSREVAEDRLRTR